MSDKPSVLIRVFIGAVIGAACYFLIPACIMVSDGMIRSHDAEARVLSVAFGLMFALVPAVVGAAVGALVGGLVADPGRSRAVVIGIGVVTASIVAVVGTFAFVFGNTAADVTVGALTCFGLGSAGLATVLAAAFLLRPKSSGVSL